MNEREKFVIQNIYGFYGEEKSLSKLAEHLNLSKEGVRQIKVRAEKKLYNVANQQSLQNYLENAA